MWQLIGYCVYRFPLDTVIDAGRFVSVGVLADRSDTPDSPKILNAVAYRCRGSAPADYPVNTEALTDQLYSRHTQTPRHTVAQWYRADTDSKADPNRPDWTVSLSVSD